MRNQLNREIEKLKVIFSCTFFPFFFLMMIFKAEISHSALEDHNTDRLKQAESKLAIQRKKRRVINYERGAILKKMVPKSTKLVQKSMIAEVTKEVKTYLEIFLGAKLLLLLLSLSRLNNILEDFMY